jgi:hypothetical protein
LGIGNFWLLLARSTRDQAISLCDLRSRNLTICFSRVRYIPTSNLFLFFFTTFLQT